MRTQTWKPDTCECHFEEIYDGNTFVEQGRVFNKCVNHDGVPDADIRAVIKKEMTQKATVFRTLLGHEGGLDLGVSEIVDGGLQLKSTVDFSWTYEGKDSDRTFKFELKGVSLTAKQKQDIVVFAESKVGKGQVKVT